MLILKLYRSLLFSSSLRSDLHRWLAAFPNPDGTSNDQEEVIYEDWGKSGFLFQLKIILTVCKQHGMLVLAFDFPGNHVHSSLQISFFLITWLFLCVRLPSGAVCAAVCGKPI